MINEYKQNFIDFCNNKYNFLYDYSEINYINSLSQITIKCNKCNKIIVTTPKYHKKKCFCNCKIFNNQQQKQIDFITFSNLKHGDKYDYSKVKFINNLTPVIIICKKHGEFEIIPKIHKNGSGCKYCNQNIRKEEELINDFNKIHNNKYTYDLKNYKNLKSKINIICPIHGNFLQEVGKHLVGSECRKCANKKISLFKTKDINIMINEFKVKHKDIYDYSNMNYKNFSTKINVICKEHGNFKIFPANHKSGVGCPKCNKSSKPMELNDLLQKFNSLYNNKYKYPNISNLYKN